MNTYLVVLFVMLLVASATYAFLLYDEVLPNGAMANIAHHFRYVFSGLRQGL
jgi:hypothetical protein